MQRPWNYSGNAGMLSVNGYDEFLQLVDTVLSYEQIDKYEICTLVGPGGSGKTKVAKELEKKNFQLIKTYTTAKKSGENYIHLSTAEFMLMKENGFFSETSMYMGECYGIVNKDIKESIKNGYIPLLILDINGTMAVSRFFKNLKVFVESPKQKNFVISKFVG